ncbi:hypothetical protein VP1G_05102 [Cytospora mali]|uniref:Uncharacterized protein n=1 Tax=Cytospora mali TaxID=578113 RepID=A0A194V1J5_CYTMA|nr:hypothetical protein VP1G_05102 [Valsa mali var. pyri (nom. inval.)]
MSCLLRKTRSALAPASLRSSNSFGTNLIRWVLHPRSSSSTSGPLITPSPRRAIDSHQRSPKQPLQQRDGALPDSSNRAVIITGLEHDVTVTEVLQSIARTAPVGAVSAAFLLPLQSPFWKGPKRYHQDPKSSTLGGAVKVSFCQRGAALELVRLSRDKIFRVRGRAPYVTEDRKAILRKAFQPPPLNQGLQTRVLVLEGPTDIRGFDTPSIRKLLSADAEAMANAGYYGILSEPVITTNTEEGRRRIEWPFFSYSAQALPFKRVIKNHFGDQLKVTHGRDPCCPEHMWREARKVHQKNDREREKDARKIAKTLTTAHQKSPASSPVSRKDVHESSQKLLKEKPRDHKNETMASEIVAREKSPATAPPTLASDTVAEHFPEPTAEPDGEYIGGNRESSGERLVIEVPVVRYITEFVKERGQDGPAVSLEEGSASFQKLFVEASRDLEKTAAARENAAEQTTLESTANLSTANLDKKHIDEVKGASSERLEVESLVETRQSLSGQGSV